MSTDRRTLFAGSGAIAAAMALPAAAQQAAAPAPATAGQAPGFYRFKVGGLTVTTVHDGMSRRPVEGFVRNAPLADVQAVLAESFLPADTFTIPFTVTFVETPQGLVVFDAGTGGQLAPTAGQMHANMRAAGLDPAAVRAVIVSHFHGDHITGLTTAQNAVVFPNAEIVVPAAEWAWFTDASNEARSPEGQRGTFSNVARRFAPYQGKVRQVADGAEVVPGIRAVAAHGHTPGHTVYHVADGNAQMMFLADLTNRPELFARRPDFQAVFDFDGDMAAATRRRVLDRAAADRMLVTGYHFPFPANGFIAKEGQGYRYVPNSWSSAV
jgi:glyoxylase-like metal-dependent hydrolase (beta-lactamase superfamily II)